MNYNSVTNFFRKVKGANNPKEILKIKVCAAGAMFFISCWDTVYSLLMCCRNMTSLQRAAGDPGARPTLEELRQDTREVGFLLFDKILIVCFWFFLLGLFVCSLVCSFSLWDLRSFVHSVYRSFDRSVVLWNGLLVYRSIGLSIYRSIGRLVIRSFGPLVVRSFVRLFVRSFGRLVFQSIGWFG